jgi:hypothetical protein
MSKRALLDGLSEAERDALAARVHEAVARVGGQTPAAAAAGLSVRQIAAYAAGECALSLLPAARLARAANVGLEWLATGEGPKERSQTASSTTVVDAPHADTSAVDDLYDLLFAATTRLLRAGETPRTVRLVVRLALGDFRRLTVGRGDT